jgi:hypothetical protein
MPSFYSMHAGVTTTTPGNCGHEGPSLWHCFRYAALGCYPAGQPSAAVTHPGCWIAEDAQVILVRRRTRRPTVDCAGDAGRKRSLVRAGARPTPRRGAAESSARRSGCPACRQPGRADLLPPLPVHMVMLHPRLLQSIAVCCRFLGLVCPSCDRLFIGQFSVGGCRFWALSCSLPHREPRSTDQGAPAKDQGPRTTNQPAPLVPHVLCARFLGLSNRAARKRRPNRAQLAGPLAEAKITRKKVCAPDCGLLKTSTFFRGSGSLYARSGQLPFSGKPEFTAKAPRP